MSKELFTVKNVDSVIEIEYRKFEELVEKHYGHSFCFVSDNEAGNDVTLTFGSFNKNDKLDEYELEDIEIFKKTGKYEYITNTLIQDLVIQGVLPENSEIQISICW